MTRPAGHAVRATRGPRRAIIASDALPDPTHVLRMFQKACRECGETKTMVIHGLRHTRNTRLRKAGVDKDLRMKILGHTSEEVNAGYDHMDLDDQRAAAKAVEELRGDQGQIGVVLPFKTA